MDRMLALHRTNTILGLLSPTAATGDRVPLRRRGLPRLLAGELRQAADGVSRRPDAPPGESVGERKRREGRPVRPAPL